MVNKFNDAAINAGKLIYMTDEPDQDEYIGIISLSFAELCSTFDKLAELAEECDANTPNPPQRMRELLADPAIVALVEAKRDE